MSYKEVRSFDYFTLKQNLFDNFARTLYYAPPLNFFTYSLEVIQVLDVN